MAAQVYTELGVAFLEKACVPLLQKSQGEGRHWSLGLVLCCPVLSVCVYAADSRTLSKGAECFGCVWDLSVEHNLCPDYFLRITPCLSGPCLDSGHSDHCLSGPVSRSSPYFLLSVLCLSRVWTLSVRFLFSMCLDPDCLSTWTVSPHAN